MFVSCICFVIKNWKKSDGKMWHRFPIEWKYERSALFAVVASDKYLSFSFVQSIRSDADASILIVCIFSLNRADAISAYWMSITSSSPEWKRHSETKTQSMFIDSVLAHFSILLFWERERKRNWRRKKNNEWILIHFMLCIVSHFLRMKLIEKQTNRNCIHYCSFSHSKNGALGHIFIKIHGTRDAIAFQLVAMQLNCALSFAASADAAADVGAAAVEPAHFTISFVISILFFYSLLTHYQMAFTSTQINSHTRSYHKQKPQTHTQKMSSSIATTHICLVVFFWVCVILCIVRIGRVCTKFVLFLSHSFARFCSFSKRKHKKIPLFLVHFRLCLWCKIGSFCSDI